MILIIPSPVRLKRQRGQVWVCDRKMQLKHLSWPQESIRQRRWDLKQSVLIVLSNSYPFKQHKTTNDTAAFYWLCLSCIRGGFESPDMLDTIKVTPGICFVWKGLKLMIVISPVVGEAARGAVNTGHRWRHEVRTCGEHHWSLSSRKYLQYFRDGGNVSVMRVESQLLGSDISANTCKRWTCSVLFMFSKTFHHNFITSHLTKRNTVVIN